MPWLSKLAALGLGSWLTFVGSALAIIGVLISAGQQGRDQKKLLAQSEQIASKSDQIAALNQELTNYVTGGNSYCWIFPMIDNIANRVTLALANHGKYPLRNIQVRIIDETKLRDLPFNELGPREPISKDSWLKYLRSHDAGAEFEALSNKAETKSIIDILYPHSEIMFNLPQFPDAQSEQHWLIEIFTSNSHVWEEIRTRKIEKEGWRSSWRVTKTDLDGSEKVVEENINPNVPLKEGGGPKAP